MTDLLASVAAQAAAQFADGNARVRGSSVVHAVHAERWLGDIEVPAPACRVGVSGWDLSATVDADRPVTTVLCPRGKA